MRSPRRRAPLALAVLLAACGGSPSSTATRLDITQNYTPAIPTEAQPASIRHIALQPFAGGSLTHSGIHTAVRQVIRDAATWQSVWSEIFSDVSPQPPLPAVDFSTDMVVLAAQGDQKTGGFGIFIDGAFTTLDGAMIVAVTSASPGPGCFNPQQVTQPVDAAAVAKAAAVSFTERLGVFHCGSL
ncbi:MAG TPA: protease complex subunit PrcB family protein [Myxococcales bacterium]